MGARRLRDHPRVEFLDWLADQGGVCTVQAARELLTKEQLDAARGQESLWTPLRGWVALVGVRNDVTRALQHGGVVTCASALRMHGLWTPHAERRLHVRVNRQTNSARVASAESAAGVVVHRMHHRFADRRPPRGIDPVMAALAVASGCVTPEDLVAAAETALVCGKVHADDIALLSAALPRRRRRGLERLSMRSGSGLESTFAMMLRSRRIRYVQQFEPVPSMFVDFLIGTSLVVELDSRSWHGRPVDLERDRRRDALLTALGYRTLRFTYEQILFQRDWVLEQVLGLIRRDVHRRKVWAA